MVEFRFQIRKDYMFNTNTQNRNPQNGIFKCVGAKTIFNKRFKEHQIRLSFSPIHSDSVKAMKDNDAYYEYFNCEQLDNGHYRVEPNCNFMRLYRLTIGKLEKERYSKAEQLMGHLVNSEFDFSLEFVLSKENNNQKVHNVKSIVPCNPVFNEKLWYQTGLLIAPPRRYTRNRAKAISGV